MEPTPTTETEQRRRWLSVLATAQPADLESAWAALERPPSWVWVRRPETGMTMVRGRAGGSGAAFNLGEMTVTRCALRLDAGPLGIAYVRGRDHRHAELAAAFDALLQTPERHDEIRCQVIAPLEGKARERLAAQARRTAATRVDFFTMASLRSEP